MTYKIPVEAAQAEIIIKKSVFKSYAYPITSREELQQFLTTLKKQYPDAGHHCFGYIIGNPSNTTSAGFDDDGEPNGTAGKPILNVLQHKAIGNCAVIVVRYFGGVKLGAGGLTRAYAQSAQAVIDLLSLQKHVPHTTIKLVTDFATEAQCRHLIGLAQASIVDVSYSHHVIITVHIAVEKIEEIQDSIGGFKVTLKTEV